MTDAPTIIEQPSLAAIEAAKAKFWRKTIMRMTVADLARATGYCEQTIIALERGYAANGKRIPERAWRKYRLVCAGVTMDGFDWIRARAPRSRRRAATSQP